MIYPATHDIVVLQNASFKLRIAAATSGVPINLTGYTIDADICNCVPEAGGTACADSRPIETFTTEILTPASGLCQIELEPVKTARLAVGTYKYDVSATSPDGERYYWLKGNVTVSGTCSRN